MRFNGQTEVKMKVYGETQGKKMAALKFSVGKSTTLFYVVLIHISKDRRGHCKESPEIALSRISVK